LPPLDVLASLFARDDHDELGDFAARHPLAQLCHYPFDVGFHLIVRGD